MQYVYLCWEIDTFNLFIQFGHNDFGDNICRWLDSGDSFRHDCHYLVLRLLYVKLKRNIVVRKIETFAPTILNKIVWISIRSLLATFCHPDVLLLKESIGSESCHSFFKI